MAIVFTLQGGSVSSATALGELGLSSLVRTLRSLAADEVTFNHDGAAIDSTPLFGYGDVLTIRRVVDGTPTVWFKGIVTELPRAGRGRMESIAYRVIGTWWYFENLVYQQVWPLDPTVNSHLTSPSTYRRAIVVAGIASATLLRQNTKDFVKDVLDWLIGSGTGAVTQYTAGELPTGFNVPFTRMDAPTCAEAIRHILRWQPDACSWFDYTTTPPKFNLHRRDAADVVTIDLADLNVTELSLTPRYDLQVEKMVIQFVTAPNGVFRLDEDKDPSGSGTTGREFGSVVVTIDNNYQPLPTGLAANYRAGLATLQYAGSLTITERECSQSFRPGQLLNVDGGAAEWEEMEAQVQEVTEELDTGRTVVRVGPPTHIRLDDLLEVLKIARGQVDETGSTEVLKVGGTKSKTAKQLTKDFSPAAAKPTATEIATAIEQAYTGQPAPYEGDEVDLTIDSVLRYTAYVHYQDPATPGSTGFVVGITVGGVTRYAKVIETGAVRTIVQALSPAGAVPTDTEIAAGLVTAFASVRPFNKEAVVFTISGTPKLKYQIEWGVSAASGTRVVACTVNSRTFYAVQQPIGVY